MEPITLGHAPHDVGHVHGLVKLDINGKKYELIAGPHKVEAIKKIASIPLADELEQIVDQRLRPLADDATVEVKDCDWFVSHPRDCQSS